MRCAVLLVFVLFAVGKLKNKCLLIAIARSLGQGRVFFYINTGLQHFHLLSLSHRNVPLSLPIHAAVKDPGKGTFKQWLPLFYHQLW